MESLSCRLLPFATADGPHNMAADETLLDAALAGTASFRCYGWSEATLSLGYFQPVAERDNDQRLAKLPYVRRPSGGAAIVHHFDLTYALAVPADRVWHDGEPWLQRMHRVTAAALGALGIEAQLHTATVQPAGRGLLCFKDQMQGDVLIGGAKIVGSAQRRRKGALLQHGSVLLTVSPFAPRLPGIRELSGHGLTAPPLHDALIAAFSQQTGWSLAPADWSETERHRVKELTLLRYSQDSWNRRR